MAGADAQRASGTLQGYWRLGFDTVSLHRSSFFPPSPRPSTSAAPSAADSVPVQRVVKEVARRLVGQDAMVERLLVGLLTGGHILLEGVPGLAKTLAVRSPAHIIDASFSRIQCT